MQLAKTHFDTRQTGARFNVHRDPAALISHGDAAIGAQCDEDLLAVTAECLVDGVVDDLPEAVHRPSGVVCPDVHRGSFATRLKPLENQQMPRLIVAAFRCGAGSWHGLRVPRTGRRSGAKGRQSDAVSDNETPMAPDS